MSDIVKVATIRQALEASLNPATKCVYLTHPVTTGGRPMAENIKRASVMAAQIRQVSRPIPVVNPTGIGHIPGWGHDDWMSLWLPFIRERVCQVVLAPDWASSTGCTMEKECARYEGIQVVGFEEFTS